VKSAREKSALEKPMPAFTRLHMPSVTSRLWILTAAIGLLITLSVFAWSLQKAHEQETSVFNYRSQTHIVRLQQALHDAEISLRDYSDLLGTEFNPNNPHPLTMEELIGFTTSYVERHRRIAGLGWAQFTPREHYAALVEQVKYDAPAGMQVSFPPLQDIQTESILPVLYSTLAEFRIGENLSQRPGLESLVRASIEHHQSRAWIDEIQGVYRLHILLSVRNNHSELAGIAFGTWSLHDLLESGIAREPVAGIDIRIHSPLAGREIMPEVYVHQSRSGTANEEDTTALQYSNAVDFAGLPLTFTTLAAPNFQKLSAISHLDSYLILVLGLFLTALSSRHMYRHMRFTELLHLEIDHQMLEISGKESRFQHLMAVIPDAVGVHQQGKWIYVNPAAVAAFGAESAEELLQSNVLERVHPDDRAEAAKRIRKEISQGVSAPLKATKMLRLDGSMFYGEVQGRPYSDEHGKPAILIVMRDITVRKQAELELVRLKLAISQADDVMFITDASGRMEYANASCLKEFGITDQEWQGKFAAELRGGHLHNEVDEDIITTLDQGQPIQREISFTNALGDDRIVWRKISPVIEEGRVAYHVCVDHDLTEQRRMQGKMESIHRLESLGVMAGGIAHDFNNLLAAIVGNNGLIARRIEPDSRLHTYVKRINSASESAAALCRQMLSYAGNDSISIQAMELNDAIREIDKLMQVSLHKNIRLNLQLEEGLPPALADAGKIKQLAMSLVSNANDAIGDTSGGEIHLATGRRKLNEKDAALCFGSPDFSAGDYLFIEVRDNGCGMDKATMGKIFDPFFTTRFTGRGLGLAAVLGIVKSHGAGIVIDSRIDSGSSFRVYLPVAGAAAERTTNMQAEPSTPPEQPIGVLMIDDDAMIRDIASEILGEFGLTVLTAADGADGIEMFRKHRQDVDVIMLDLTMPHMSGEECFKLLKQIDSKVPIIICSGYGESDTIEQLEGLSPAAYVHKPFHPDSLVASIRQAAAI